jgi:5-(carboxyamino)imidazole ribonucleotide synthase
VIEQKVNIKKELSVIAARDVDGNVKCFTSTEMVFDDEANLVTLLICPAQISEDIAQKAEQLAMETINAFGIVGLLAVELFLDVNDELLINEVAPRPHNSGHHTIENAITSQYEQQLRAVMGLPLGSTQTILPAVMINLLGEPGYSGPVKYQGIEQCMAVDGAKFHIYGKTETKPFRKMGHITIIDQSIENAQKKAELIQKTLKVIS